VPARNGAGLHRQCKHNQPVSHQHSLHPQVPNLESRPILCRIGPHLLLVGDLVGFSFPCGGSGVFRTVSYDSVVFVRSLTEPLPSNRPASEGKVCLRYPTRNVFVHSRYLDLQMFFVYIKRVVVSRTFSFRVDVPYVQSPQVADSPRLLAEFAKATPAQISQMPPAVRARSLLNDQNEVCLSCAQVQEKVLKLHQAVNRNVPAGV
jgi:hypothetical protein